MRICTTLFLIFCCNCYIGFATASEGAIGLNCIDPKTNTKTYSPTSKASGKELTVIQTVESCPKNQSGSSSQGIELIEKSAKYALDGAAESTKKSAEFAQSALDSIKTFIIWMGGFLTFLLALAALLGWKSVKDLKSDAHDTAEKHLQKAVADFESTSKVKLDEIIKIHEESLKTKAETLDSNFEWKFASKFASARMESLIANTLKLDETTRNQLMRSAISSYTSLISDVGKINLSVITDIVTSQSLRFEAWDNAITDDRAFFTGWLYRDKAILQRRLGDIQNALKTVEAATKVNPMDWGLFFNLGCYQSLTGNLPAAISTAIQCLNSPHATELATWIRSDTDYKDVITDPTVQSLLAKYP